MVGAGDLLAEKRTGKQVLNLKPGETAVLCIPAEGDHVAVIGTNRKMLVFPLDQVPELGRGAGVLLQKYRDGKLADAKVFRLADGLSWPLGDRTRTEMDLRSWIGARATSWEAAAERLSEVGAVRLVAALMQSWNVAVCSSDRFTHASLIRSESGLRAIRH